MRNFVELAEGSREWTDPRTRQATTGTALRRDDLPPRDPPVHDPGRGPARHGDRRPRLPVRRRDPPGPAGSTGRTCWPWPTPAPAPTARSSSSPWCRRRTSTASTPSSARSSTAAMWSTGSARSRPAGTTAPCRTSCSSRSRSSGQSGAGEDRRISGLAVATRPQAQRDQGTGVPTCFRHPGRETYVSCVRCGRPACPDCLRSAAVGQQCVECVREGNRGTRQAGAVFGGGRSPARWSPGRWSASTSLLYLVELARPSLANDSAMIGLGRFAPGGPLQGVVAGPVVPADHVRVPAAARLAASARWTSSFNMWALILVGPALERLLGHVRYLTVYLVSALGGSVVFYLLGPLRTGPSAPRAPSSACSGRGSWWPGGCGWTAGGSSRSSC